VVLLRVLAAHPESIKMMDKKCDKEELE